MKRVFIIEDSEDLRDAIEGVIEDFCEVSGTGSIAQAVEHLGRPDAKGLDLIICDKSLPDGHGFQFVDFFKNSGRKTPIIMLTGDTDVDEKIKGFSLDIDDYLTKPIDLRELRQRIRKTIGE